MPLPPPALRLERRSYSVHPWRIVHGASGKEVAGASFPRQREGRPVLAALLALDAPWDLDWSQWPETVLQAARAIVDACPGTQVHAQALARYGLERAPE